MDVTLFIFLQCRAHPQKTANWDTVSGGYEPHVNVVKKKLAWIIEVSESNEHENISSHENKAVIAKAQNT